MTAAREGIVPAPIHAALQNALRLGEIGLQVVAYHRGRLIVDAWAGAKAPGGEPVDGDTLFNTFSTGKALISVAAHIQADRGLLDYDTPIAAYWPEYGKYGKEHITVRHLLTHRSGAPQMPLDVDVTRWRDWEWMTAELAEIRPLFPAGTRNTYLSMVYGWLLGEVIRRTDPSHRALAVFIREEICAPLGMDEFYTGLPAAHETRVATLSYPVRPPPPADDALVRLAVPKALDFMPEFFNRSDVRQTRLSGFGDISNARSVARFFAMVAGGGQLNGKRIVSEAALLGATRPRPDYELYDETYGQGRSMLVGNGGFWVAQPDIPPLDRRGDQKILCHPGAGSSIGWADLDHDLAIAILHNRMFTIIEESPWPAIAAAVLEVAGVTR